MRQSLLFIKVEALGGTRISRKLVAMVDSPESFMLRTTPHLFSAYLTLMYIVLKFFTKYVVILKCVCDPLLLALFLDFVSLLILAF
jgi:hypothetical protein